MNDNLKKSVITAYEFCDKLDNTLFGVKQYGMTARKTLELELLRYILWLARLDSEITEQELQVIKDYLDIEFSREEANKIAGKVVEDRKKVMTIPLILQRAVMLDNFMYDNGRSCEWCTVAEWLVSLYDAVGEEVINSKGYVLECEVRGYEVYHMLLKEYMKNRLCKEKE